MGGGGVPPPGGGRRAQDAGERLDTKRAWSNEYKTPRSHPHPTHTMRAWSNRGVVAGFSKRGGHLAPKPDQPRPCITLERVDLKRTLAHRTNIPSRSKKTASVYQHG